MVAVREVQGSDLGEDGAISANSDGPILRVQENPSDLNRAIRVIDQVELLAPINPGHLMTRAKLFDLQVFVHVPASRAFPDPFPDVGLPFCGITASFLYSLPTPWR